MKKFYRLGLIGMTALGALAGAQQANATDETGNASVDIIAPITVNEDTAMDFASIVADAAGDSVVLTAAGSISATGDSTFTGTPAAGVFDVTGEPSTNVTITFSTGNTLTGPGTAMPIGTFTHNAGGSPALSGGGLLTFNVGATLTVGATQTEGAYAGTYTVTVDYP